GEDVLADLRAALFSRMLGSSGDQRSGFLAAATNDIGNVAWQVGSIWPSTSGAMFTAAASAVALVVVDARLAAVVLAWCALLLLPVTRWYCRRAAADVKVFFQAYEVFTDRFEELADGAATARRFGRTDLAGRFEAPNTAEAVAYAQTHILCGRYLATIALLRGGTVALVLLLAPLLATGAQRLAVIAGFVAALPGLFGSLDRLGRLLGYAQLGVVALARLADLEPAPLATSPAPRPASAPRLSAHALSQRYPDSGFHLGPIDVAVPAGCRLALVGPTGAGKSTLGRLLAGLEAPAGGIVALGGAPLPAVPEAFGARPVVMLPQEHHLFPGTVADNLRLARADATDRDLLATLESLSLRAWLDGLPDGLATPVDGHRHVSDGERQLIALGQVVLLDPSVVILDEPTSALDPATARILERAAALALAGRTVVLITHHLASAATCDEIVVLDAGQMAERGNHRQLLASDGLYSRLWSTSQQGA
ncbi:MAG: ATP-binding cassette domain-containing protein, partial [Egibacteraceae bacterium]